MRLPLLAARSPSCCRCRYQYSTISHSPSPPTRTSTSSISSRGGCRRRKRTFHTLESIYGKPNPQYVNATQAPTNFHRNSALVFPNFITEEESSALEHDIFKRMRRKRFEKGHWDAVITGYKEIEIDIDHGATLASGKSSINTGSGRQQGNLVSNLSCQAIQGVRDHIARTHFNSENNIDENSVVEWSNCHAIHLKKDGELTAHVDSVKFSGGIVAGLSLLSPSIMRLRPAAPSELSISNDYGEAEDTLNLCESAKESPSPDASHEEYDGGNNVNSRKTLLQGKSLMNRGHVDLFLPPLSLYILSGVSRYRYTHELLPSGSQFVLKPCHSGGATAGEEEDRGAGSVIYVDRDDRISVIFRDTLPP